jgi:Ala-tRNA(Pro) deacylase
MALTDEDLYERLKALGVDWETTEHAAVFTVEESQALCGDIDGIHIKNLFLRDKKKRLWLCTVREDRDIDLKALRKRLGAQGTLSFGAPDLLMEVLGVIPGAVTPFGIINDVDRRVTVVLDEGLFDHGLVNAHPLRNDRTTTLSGADLVRFVEAEGYEPLRIDFGAPLLAEDG